MPMVVLNTARTIQGAPIKDISYSVFSTDTNRPNELIFRIQEVPG